MTRKLPPRATGFTLIELIAALGITVVIGGILASTIFTAFKVKKSADDALAAARGTDIITEVIRHDFEQAVPPDGIFAGQFSGRADYISFYASGGDSAQPVPGDIKLVEIYLSEDPNLPRTLVRRVTTNLTPGDSTNTPAEEPLYKNVTAFSTLYYDGTQWTDTWDSTQHQDADGLDVPPMAVQLDMTIAAPNQPEQHVTITAGIPCAQLQTTSTFGGGL